MTPFKLTDELLAEIKQLVENQKDSTLESLLGEVHYADVAEIIDELKEDEATYLIKLLDSDKTSDILAELDEDIREAILGNLSTKEIAEELEELDTDDAADIVGELPEEIVQEVISEIEDKEHAKDIVDLLRYDENSAGGLMAKELVKVRDIWNVQTCVKEMRAQAENVTRVHSIYVVDDNEKLIGRLSLKDLLTTPIDSPIRDVYTAKKVDFVNVNEDPEEVAKIMSKYDLEAIPVVDDIGRLVGRITIDDIVDVIKEEAEKDYQLAAGISQDVEADDGIWELTRARLPWLILGLFGGLGAAIATFIARVIHLLLLSYFVSKEISISLLNVLKHTLGLYKLAYAWVWKGDFMTALAISASLIAVIIVAGFVGTFTPLFLDKRGIDPAIATGPFITTSNDIFGILIYFLIAKLILGI